MFYDLLLLLAIWFFSTVVILPFTGGEAVSSDNIIYSSYLYMIAGVYFIWQWGHGGQTLGMRAWRIKLVTLENERVDWYSAAGRFLLATLSLLPLGAGFFWGWMDRDGLAAHDRLSGTCLLLTGKY